MPRRLPRMSSIQEIARPIQAQVGKLAYTNWSRDSCIPYVLTSLAPFVNNTLLADRKRPRDALDDDGARLPKTLPNQCEHNLDSPLDKLFCFFV